MQIFRLQRVSAPDASCCSRVNCILKELQAWDFPGGAVVKNPPANAGDTGSSPGPGRSSMPESN